MGRSQRGGKEGRQAARGAPLLRQQAWALVCLVGVRAWALVPSLSVVSSAGFGPLTEFVLCGLCSPGCQGKAGLGWA